MAFWKPGAIGPGLDRETDGEGGLAAVNNPFSRFSIDRQRRMLPVFRSRTEFLYCVETFRSTIIVGETGSGKTTQLPQYLHEAGWTAGGRRVACTQPRRVSAVTVATRVAEEMGVEVGREVGFAVRFDHRYSDADTRILYMTDGHLLRELMGDPLLRRYSVVVLDEAHERNAHTDLLLGLLRKVMARRPDLRLVVSSATLQAHAFKRYLETNTTDDPRKDTACVLAIDGRTFPVDVLYLTRPAANYVQACVDTVLRIHAAEPPGDVLVFLPGTEEIDEVVHEIKVVVATNIAETSITIDGIVYVVDSMFARLPGYDPSSGLESLVIQPISRASSIQRAGRAGRVRGGKCYRMCTSDAWAKLKPFNVPELQRTSLHGVVLQLKALGIDDVVSFPYPSPPHPDALARALELLYVLKVIDDDARLTRPMGLSVCELPVDPRMACMLLASLENRCAEEALTVCAMLSVQHPYVHARSRGQKQQQDFALRALAAKEGDHLTFLNIFNAYVEAGCSDAWAADNMMQGRALARAVEIRRQLKAYVNMVKRPDQAIESCEDDPVPLQRSILQGYISNAARLLPNGNYATVRDGREITIHSSSVVHRFGHVPQWIVYHDVVLTTAEVAREVTEIHPKWLVELAPHYYEAKPSRR